jgi:hypothetical protein
MLAQKEIGESMKNSTLFLILYENLVDQLRTDKRAMGRQTERRKNSKELCPNCR